MAGFAGIRRRFEYQIVSEDRVFIDDYAHHPREIEATILSLRDLYPDKKLTGIFQPHLFTRTRDFAGGFAESLSLLDELILLDIYPAREMPIPGVTSEMILHQVKLSEKILCGKEDLPDILAKRNPEVLITLGAGDIDKLVEPIKKQLLLLQKK
jgi:UDP-N-acetylmuramate--alanine ligase